MFRVVVSIVIGKKIKIKMVPGTKFRVGVLNFHFIVIFHLVPGTYFKNLKQILVAYSK